MAPNTNLNKALETRRELAPQKSALQTVYDLIETNKAQIAKALPQSMPVERFARTLMNTVRANPDLLQCTQRSLVSAFLMASQLGLEPGVLGHCYFIPFNNSKEKCKEVQFIVGYRGMIDLARRSGQIKSINAHPVYTGDQFNLQYGLEEKCDHVPYHVLGTEQGEFKGAYCIAHFVDGGHAILYMPKNEIIAHRNRSKAANSGPWVSDFEQMALKTVVRGLFKWLPVSIEAVRQVMGSDETIKTTISDSMADELDLATATDVQIASQDQSNVLPTIPVTQEPEPAKVATEPEMRGKFTVAQSKIMAIDSKLRDQAMKNLGIDTPPWQLTDEQCISIEGEVINLL